MAKDSGQNFGNHAQFTPIYHYFTAPLAVIFWIWAARRAATLRDIESHFDLLGATVMFGLVAVARVSPLRVQDRVIRLEEQLRLARVLPADLQSRVGELRPAHLVALRFASDEEVTELVRKVLANPAMTQKEIKQQVRNWKGDYFRA
jgi:hypothetical protein